MNSMDNGTKDSVDGLFEYDIEYSCITDISFFWFSLPDINGINELKVLAVDDK